VPDDLEPTPSESELDEADMLLNVLGSGAKVNPDLVDDSPAVRLVKGLAAHRDDIDAEPLSELVSQDHAVQIVSGGKMSGFDTLADQFLGLKGMIPSVGQASAEAEGAEQALAQIKAAAVDITGESSGTSFAAEVERINAVITELRAAAAKATQALSELPGVIDSTANAIRNRQL
jgi:hypothetical protein